MEISIVSGRKTCSPLRHVFKLIVQEKVSVKCCKCLQTTPIHTCFGAFGQASRHALPREVLCQSVGSPPSRVQLAPQIPLPR